MTDRWLELDGVVNMRDVGGLVAGNGRTVQRGRLIRSDNLQDLSEKDIRYLVDEVGVSDIVDLRTETELTTEGPGPLRRLDLVTHHHHSLFDDRPQTSASDALLIPAGAEHTSRDARFWAEHYLGYLARRPDSVMAALEVIASASGAAVVHCAAGKDRTGTVVGVALDVAGVSHDDIAADYALSAERIERIIGRLVDRPAYTELLRDQAVDEQRPSAESMLTILATLREGFGGSSGWLRTNGWTDREVEVLRAKLLD